MKDNENQVKYEAIPTVLEMNNGDVAYEIKGNFPAKYFNKKATLTVTPVLTYEGGQIELKSKTLQGEAVQANDQVINSTTGGSFDYSDKFAYKDEMRLSKLELKVTAKLKDEKLDIGTYKVAEGILATSKLVQLEPKTISLPDNFQRTSPEIKMAAILYVINKYDIRTSELKKDDVKALSDYVKAVSSNPKYKLNGIEISSYASPDGSVELNTKLSGNRGGAAEKFLMAELKKAKLAEDKDLLKTLTTPEDWDGFKSLMEKSDIKDKDLVLRVLSMYSDPDVREKEIKNISKAYQEIAEKILPQLRRSKFIVKADAVGYSNEEMLSLADSHPDTFKLEEILFAASLVQDLNKKAALYQKASDKFPTDVRAKNNLGFILIKLGKLDEAKTALEAAKTIDNNDAVKTNLGAVAMLQGDLPKAEEYFTAAVGAGEAPNYNMGIISITKGKYEVAIGYFGNSCGFNPALAKVLSSKLEDALSSLNCSKEESAKEFYLKSIIGARMQNGDMVYNNMRTAVGKEPKLKDYAKKDAEFLKYLNDETFKSIVQ
jgi:tetratricopeptide (TPR) repeat protein/outer membrane protein OmpA-like peptidoglycan-associated protein